SPRRSTSCRGCRGSPAMKRSFPRTISCQAFAGVVVGVMFALRLSSSRVPDGRGESAGDDLELVLSGRAEQHEAARGAGGRHGVGQVAGILVVALVVHRPLDAVDGLGPLRAGAGEL